ncbi:MAG TPA: glycosyltransferase [Nitrososphaeraceae archaeon]|nr:glycosyltransferase [Nitrososphaeraceae archaeon]
MTFQHQQKIDRFAEMDKKRWFVRYLILAGIGSVLAIKLYLLLFIVDFTVGVYSFMTSFIIFYYFFNSFIRFRDPYLYAKDIVLSEDNKPLVSMIVPVKNEEDNIRNCVQSCVNSTYSKKEIIIVNDGSTDKTSEILDEMRREVPNIKIVHLSKSVGKKQATEAGCQIAKGDIFLFMDSDCDIYSDAVEKAVKIFKSDRRIGAVTGHARIRNAEKGNLLEKIQDVWFDGQFRILKGAETSFSSLTCCSGALSIFRREAVAPHIHAWAHDRFLGMENFKFCTDRRLTAYVLGAKPSDVWKNNSNLSSANNNNTMPTLLQIGKDDINTMKSSSDPDVKNPRKGQRAAWKLVYSPSVRVNAGVPTTLPSLLRQQIRWRKSFIRSLFATGGIFWRRPLGIAIVYYVTLGLKLLRPFIIIKAVIFLPLTGDIVTASMYLVGALYSGMLYGIDVRLRHPGYKFWIYRPIMTFLSTFVISWLVIYAAITIRKEAWR